ncbi:SusC/RagA family TonB-linked outer membrane protein [Chitinophaga agrisoli]|uniref:SusC/RagA family TonB-linked outer membrane protein n=1 Tax=Chitinophaga agrisoli TaxID=2607653 RepID=UPI001661A64D|nr:SusC/RagA family TonB-linked outer membrane protein [Chitinophaga agrisoli]
MQISARVAAQSVTFSGKNVALEKVLTSIESQTNYVFFYNEALVRDALPVTITVSHIPLETFLKDVFKNQSLDYTIKGKTIVISRKHTPPVSAPANRQAGGEPANKYRIFEGMVLSAAAEDPLAAVSIRVKNKPNSGAHTNEKGRFAIRASVGDVLIVSTLGYETQEVSLANTNLLLLLLQPSNSSLDEVQITAYGTTSKRLTTGSIFTVRGEEIARNPVPNVLQALQGRVPGLFIQQQSGLPATPVSIFIRGKSSLSFTARPLIVIDGVSYPDGNLPFNYFNLTPGILQGGNILDYLNPSLIEQVEVLKDADATSIFGSRGAYGVILITTKRGKPGKPQLSFSARSGFMERGTTVKLLNTQQYLLLRREALKNNNAQPGPADLDINGTWPEDRYTDWQNLFTGSHGQTSDLNLNYSGSAGNTTFLLGGNFRRLESVQRKSGDLKSGGMNFNITTATPNQKLSLFLSAIYNSTVNKIIPVDFTNNNNSNFAAPNAPSAFLPDGSINWAPDALVSPADSTSLSLASPFALLYNNTTNSLTSSMELKYMPVTGLTLRATVGYFNAQGKQFIGQPTAFFNPRSTFLTTSSLNTYNLRTWSLDPNINYIAPLGPSGTLSATAGATLMDRLSYRQSVTGSGFISDAQLYNPSAAPPGNVATVYMQTPGKYLGYFGILNYNLANKYIVNGQLRYDGSTRFGRNKQFGVFGSVGVAWNISEEPWFRRLLPVVNFAKLRASWGTVGGDAIQDYQFLNTYTYNTLSTYQGDPSLIPLTLANPDLEFEKNTKRELGLSIEVLKGKLALDLNYYNNTTSNQLLTQPLASTTGYSSITKNSPGIIKSYGWEVVLNTVNMRTRNFTWTTSLNISIPKNILVAYPSDEILTQTSLKEGASTQGQKLYKYAGVDPQTGNYTFYKEGVKGEWTFVSGGALDEIKDKTEFVDLAPKYFGGLQNTLQYKNFSLTFLFSFTNRMARTYMGSQVFHFGFMGRNGPASLLRRWQRPGDITDVAKVTTGPPILFNQFNFYNSTGAYANAGYARLNNLSLTYTLPATVLKKTHISRLSVFLQGQNLLTITGYKDWDPENLGAGVAPLRIYTAGVNMDL